MSAPEAADGKRKWRKKRKTFLSNAKKYARKGQLGRGTKMPEDTYQYFVGILEVMKKGIDTEDEKKTLVNNVLDRTRGEEITIVGNQLGCRVVELLLPYASAEDLERYMEALHPELRRLCSDNFASHVIEKLLTVSCHRATEHLQGQEQPNDETDDETPKKKVKEEVDVKPNKKLKTDENETPKKKVKLEEVTGEENKGQFTEEHVKNCYDFTLKVCKYALNNLEDFVFDNYANHILRNAIRCLSGITLLPGEKLKKNIFKDTTEHETLHKSIPPHQTNIVYRAVPDEFKEIVKDYAERLSQWPQFKDLPYKNITSGLLQVLLFAVKNVDKTLTRNILKKLLNESFAPEDWEGNAYDSKDDKKAVIDNVDENDETVEEKPDIGIKPMRLPPVFTSESATRLLEAALFVAKKKTYTQLYARCFIGRLARLAATPMLNFTVQRLFDNCTVKEELEMMFDELKEEFSAVLSCGNTGVLVSIVKACLRLKARQSQFVTSLKAALHCTAANQRYLPVLCLRLLPAERVDTTGLDREYFVHVHGSLVLQTLLQFQRPTEAVNGLLEMSAEELLVVLSDAKGCHVADAFFTAPYVGVKARDKMIWKLKGTYQRLAMNQYGSRALEVIFEAASPDQKVKVMGELADKGQILNGTPYGRLIGAKLHVELFGVSQERWRAALSKKEKVTEAFKDIVGKGSA